MFHYTFLFPAEGREVPPGFLSCKNFVFECRIDCTSGSAVVFVQSSLTGSSRRN